MFSRKLVSFIVLSFVVLGLSIVGGCNPSPSNQWGKITLGIVSYETGKQSLQQYQPFQDYLAQQTQTIVEVEPAFSELQAVDQVKRQAWSVVFAPPGLAAIAIHDAKYTPIFPLQSLKNYAVIIVKQESSMKILKNLSNKKIALGQPGSLTGYYLPLYDLYGLTLAEIQFAPTPKMALDWLAMGKVDAIAVSENQFLEYVPQLKSSPFRILHKSRPIPSGSVLFAPTFNPQQQQNLKTILQEAPPNLIEQAGYLPHTQPNDYQQLIQFIEKVKPLEGKLRNTPVILTAN
ncbi:conserved exported hypothetical protein [Planktothrix serta PCC 8927]|uniref:Uncharacterized protein n=1 Tax=Planktothrix serta PCC 8927 TaxID=671068 RepID=A0A7Z9BL89_9CYAN|nr:PhnD/SsuA/transferrin family substrate-binding protein [Planktothrix serta]VXD15131.1 conserved exported hypothetical protein [Planktothrix serta PCC 8927]